MGCEQGRCLSRKQRSGKGGASSATKAVAASVAAVQEENPTDTDSKGVTAMTPSLGLSNSIQAHPSASTLPDMKSQHAQKNSSKQNEPQPSWQQPADILWPAVALLCWTFCSSGLILLNKELIVTDGFKFPMTLTAAGQLISYIGGKTLPPPPPLGLPPAAPYSPGMTAGCSSLLHIARLNACGLQVLPWQG